MTVLSSCVCLCVSVTSCLFVFGVFRTFVSWLSSQTLWLRKSDAPVFSLILIDLLLVLLFIGQHHWMAARAYKDWFTSIGLGVLERPVYNLASALSMQIMMWLWQPLPDYSLWLLETYKGGLLWLFFCLLHIVCWVVLFLQVLSFDPLELLGLKQVWYHLKNWHTPLFYKNKYLQKLYSHMRHPGVTCFLIALWVHPIMSVDRFVLATALTTYLLCGHGVTDGDYVYIKQSVDSGHFSTWQRIHRVELKYE